MTTRVRLPRDCHHSQKDATFYYLGRTSSDVDAYEPKDIITLAKKKQTYLLRKNSRDLSLR